MENDNTKRIKFQHLDMEDQAFGHEVLFLQSLSQLGKE